MRSPLIINNNPSHAAHFLVPKRRRRTKHPTQYPVTVTVTTGVGAVVKAAETPQHEQAEL